MANGAAKGNGEHKTFGDSSINRYFILPLLVAIITWSVSYVSQHPSAQSRFMPHGFCYMWEPAVLWVHVVADAIIFVSYVLIPTELLYIYTRRLSRAPDCSSYQQQKSIYPLLLWFAIFLAGCALTHLFDVVNVWKPYYWYDAIARGLTATASVVTAYLLAQKIPALTGVMTEVELTDRLAALEQQVRNVQQAIRPKE